MPTPDLTDYVDLTFFDLDPQDVFERALVDLQSKLPEWQPREGNVEVLLLEAMAVQVAEAVLAANRVPPAVVMALLRLYGVEPDPGEQPAVDVRFVVSDALGHTIPAGTQGILELDDGLEPVVFSTLADLVIAPGATEGVTAAVGDRYTVEANGKAAGTRLDVVQSIAFLDYAELDTAVAEGRDPEDDEEWIERGVQRFTRLTETLLLPQHFRSAALEDPTVVRANVIDNWDAGDDGTSQGTDGGHVTIVVYGDGAPLSAGDKTALADSLAQQAAANLALHVIDAVVDTVDVTVTVTRAVGYAAADVQAATEEAIATWLSTATWPWADVVRRNALIAQIGAVPGVAYVDDLSVPAADQTLSTPPGGVLAEAGTVTVTVIEP